MHLVSNTQTGLTRQPENNSKYKSILVGCAALTTLAILAGTLMVGLGDDALRVKGIVVLCGSVVLGGVITHAAYVGYKKSQDH